MAITRAQQVKQMLREGGRIEFRFGGRRGDTGQASQKESKSASSNRERGPEKSRQENRAPTLSPGRSMAQFGHAGHAGKTENKAKQDQRQGRDVPDNAPSSAQNPYSGHNPNEIPVADKNRDGKVGPIERFNQYQATKFTPLRKNTLRNLVDYIAGGRKFMGLPGAIGSIYTDFTGKGLNMNVEDYEGLENVSPAQLQAMFGQDIIGTADEEKIRDISKVLGQDVVSQSDFEQFYPNMNVPDDRGGPDQQEGDPCKGPNPPAYCFANQNPTPIPPTTPTTPTSGLALRFRKDGGRINAMDGGMMSPEGGIMDLETGRQMYFLGKLVKKASRALKKITKSPLGKAAILGGALYFGGGGAGGLSGLLKKGLLKKGATEFTLANLSPMKTIGLASLGSAFLTPEEEEDDELYRGPGLDIRKIRENPYDFLGPNFANGGRIGLKDGISLESILEGKIPPVPMPDPLQKILEKMTPEEKEMFKMRMELMKKGFIRNIEPNPDAVKPVPMPTYGPDGKRSFAEGGDAEPVAKKTMPLLDMGGKEMDLRDDGGFVPIGRMEKADDVPARLSKNEFVFTAEAVRNAGEGDVDKGAEVMYNMMKNLESGGEVSEESQGLEGARRMFQTSKRLEEVL